jgi:hypothetical protein
MKHYKLILAAMLFATAGAVHAQDGAAFGDAMVVEPPKPAPPAPVQFVVQRADANIRATIARWASTAGWLFQPEYWAVDHDIPVIADASLGVDFKEAVRKLMRSTELTDVPLKPCFYTNNVVRVVPRNEKCNRTQE